MGWLDWFEKKANERLRRSQIKILYQNQVAVEYLLADFANMKGSGMEPDREVIETLELFEQYTDDCIIELSWKTCLHEATAPQLLQINNGLKNIYNGMLEGKRLFRASVGQPAGDLVQFTDRFAPAAGWDRLSETEWDGMISKALSRLPKEAPF
jgi:hypothetical protein